MPSKSCILDSFHRDTSCGKRNPGKRVMIMHIRQMYQQLLAGCKEARALTKKQGTNLMMVLISHMHIGAWVCMQPHLCVTQLDSVILLASSLHCSFKTGNLILQVVCLAQLCLVTTKYLNRLLSSQHASSRCADIVLSSQPVFYAHTSIHSQDYCILRHCIQQNGIKVME